jgi:hypothetical protein
MFDVLSKPYRNFEYFSLNYGWEILIDAIDEIRNEYLHE